MTDTAPTTTPAPVTTPAETEQDPLEVLAVLDLGEDPRLAKLVRMHLVPFLDDQRRVLDELYEDHAELTERVETLEAGEDGWQKIAEQGVEVLMRTVSALDDVLKHFGITVHPDGRIVPPLPEALKNAITAVSEGVAAHVKAVQTGPEAEDEDDDA